MQSKKKKAIFIVLMLVRQFSTPADNKVLLFCSKQVWRRKSCRSCKFCGSAVCVFSSPGGNALDFPVIHSECAFQDVLISLFLNSRFRIYRPDKCLLYSSVIDTKENSLPLTTISAQHVHSITRAKPSAIRGHTHARAHAHKRTLASTMACKWVHWFVKWHFNILTDSSL